MRAADYENKSMTSVEISPAEALQPLRSGMRVFIGSGCAAPQTLIQALLVSGADRELLLRFLRDLLSSQELTDVANRWAAAQLLLAGQTQTATVATVGLSTKTVHKVAQHATGPYTTGGMRRVAHLLAEADANAQPPPEHPAAQGCD